VLYEEFAAGLIEALELDEDEGKNISYAYVGGAYHPTSGGREPTGPESFETPALPTSSARHNFRGRAPYQPADLGITSRAFCLVSRQYS
jgi:hypothetical protein